MSSVFEFRSVKSPDGAVEVATHEYVQSSIDAADSGRPAPGLTKPFARYLPR